ncbi:MAG TPA: FADH(2)-oxidizing methylenetetrahydrofolate--tRNA-(uracil(54)-C(5))-methyltransferase TrmFO [Desulfurobacteriaceae bacterium]|nr:FADH(2)-oxidizing methylenetetrahydrofolate--tRNA-(uracil(54)-C(5))-methyltransferase TrmFO [Desulfurobacteriaceae bacterium]
MKVAIIGAGLAGSEAAWYLANKGIKVNLYEMRPKKFTPAHKTSNFAELVCSNSLGSLNLDTASGLLKKEMELLNSLVIKAAKKSFVPAGQALAVDRNKFSKLITETLENNSNIKVIREEIKSIDELDEDIILVATGPLTSDTFSENLKNILGDKYLYFYDAISPIVYADSIDFSKGFWGSRYNKGGKDYFNIPLTEEEYERFYEALINAKQVPLKDFEANYYEACLPIEEIARRGKQSLLFGPLKPVGLIDPRTGKQPYAVVQLRKENKEGSLFNLVGFQTKLTYPEQKRVFRLIPGLENAEFARLGQIHRNTFINSPKLLNKDLSLLKKENIFFAGQITGVEGYCESAASGIYAAINIFRKLQGKEPIIFPKETMIGALIHYITDKERKNFQPMGANFGILPPLDKKVKDKRKRKILYTERALNILKEKVLANI